MTEGERKNKIAALYSIVYTVQGFMSSFMCKVENPWRLQLDAMSNGEIELYFDLIKDAIKKGEKE